MSNENEMLKIALADVQRRLQVTASENDRLKQELDARRGDPVTRLHNLCRGLEEPLKCGHDLVNWCDHCETCGVCRDDGGKYSTGKLDKEIERLKQENLTLAAQVAKMREALEAAQGMIRCIGLEDAWSITYDQVTQAFAQDIAATERFVTEAIRVADYYLNTRPACNCRVGAGCYWADYYTAKEAWRVRND